MLILIFACSIGEKSLQSAQEKKLLSSLEQLEHTAAEIETAAEELESFIDQARRNIKNGESVKQQKEKIHSRIQALKDKQKYLSNMEIQLRSAILVQPNPVPRSEDAFESEDN